MFRPNCRSTSDIEGYKDPDKDPDKDTEKHAATMTSTADVSLAPGDKAKPAPAASAQAGAGGLFHRAPKKQGHNTEDMHDVLDRGRFKNDPRLPAIKLEIAEMDADGDGHLDQEEVATYILEHIDTEAAHAKTQKHAKRLGRMLQPRPRP
eukprot:scaffold12121_cov57-Phaeocystis_antarctica.AAC.3